jgi:hypothetical protein
VKNLKIIIPTIAVLLIGVTLISTAAAANSYSAVLTVDKSGKDFTFTVNTCTLSNFGDYLNRSSIVITMYDTYGESIVVPVDWTRVAISPDGSNVVIGLLKQDGLPSHASTIRVDGTLAGDHAGDTFSASGPGWAWGRLSR